MKLTDGFGAKAGGVMVHLRGVQEVSIRGLDHHGMVLVGSQLSQLLMQYWHHPKVSKEVIQSLSLYKSNDIASIHQGVII